VVAVATLSIITATEVSSSEAGVAIIMGVAVVAEAVALAEFAASSSDVASNTMVISVRVESGSIESGVRVGDVS